MKHELTPGGIAVEVESDPEAPFPPEARAVIEGYPRSANTFVTFAFEECNPGIAFVHHTHVPQTVLAGVERELPVLVLIRDPLDACASFCVYDDNLSPSRALSRWIRFYSEIAPVLGSVLLLDFERAISPALSRAFVTLGFTGRYPPGARSWQVLSRQILDRIEQGSGMKGWANPATSTDDEIRIRHLQAPSLGRRELLAGAREQLRRERSLPAALRIFEGCLTHAARL